MKIDPIHFFSSRGVSILTAEHQDERIRALEAENAQLKVLLKEASARLRSGAESAASANSEILH